ncbi:T9SS sorting signal type C domain-containing protein [Flavobacterium sp. 17A]|uniref:T9SS sorting signal type C domain-containing protein n=1 Tax=Flavobacterium potami TaxID=2872310 RepID=A0A9X1HA77_9FLAO|nr:T9SS sorting signal type C domain-containing protein [Flavobacterium potami]MBZ4035594.1 T9SS sorting signal type C domain-containing protein [Flavobacterium potami]
MKKKLLIQFNLQKFLSFERIIEKQKKIDILFKLRLLLILFVSFFCNPLTAQNIVRQFPSNGSLTVPAGLTSITVEGWGAGGSGGGASAAFLSGRSGGGGGGGAYAKGTITVQPSQVLTINVGGTTAIGTGDGANGGASFITGFNSSFYAPGGVGGIGGNGNPPNGGSGGGVLAPLAVGNQTTANGVSGTAGGTFAVSLGLASGGGGAAGNTAGGGGAGGAVINTLILASFTGNPGATYGGGGGGAVSSGNGMNGGAGAAGHMTLSYTCKTYSFTTMKAANVCLANGTTSLVELTGTPTTLPNGSYVVTYTKSLPSGPASTATMVINDGSGKGTFTATGLTAAGSSTITVTNIASQDCTSAISGPGNTFTIGVSALPPTITLGSVAAVCRSASAQSTALNYTATNAPTTYSITWATSPTNTFAAVNNAPLPASPISIAVPAGTAAGTYVGTIIVKNAGECVSTSANFNVVVNELPTIAVSNASVCFNSAVQNATLTYSSPTNAPNAYSITWSAGNPTNTFAPVSNATLTGGSITIPVPAGTLAGTYTGTLVVKNANNCSSTGNTFTITVNPLPTITTTGNLTVCQNTATASLAYTATTNSPISYSIAWTTLAAQNTTPFTFSSGGGNINTIIVPANTPAGTYPGVMTIRNANGCLSTQAVSLVVRATPTITTSGTVTAVCSSTLVQTTSLAYSATTNTPTSYSIDWATLTDQNTTPFAFASGTGNINTISVPANTPAGTYPGVMTITSANGCFSTQAVSLSVIASPVAPTTSATQQPSCADNSGIITVTSPAAGTGFSYSIDGSNFSNTTGIFTGLTAGGYNVSVRNNSTLCQSPSVLVTVNPLIVKTWNGSVSANWATPANWTPSGVPLASDCVDIPAMTTSPVISGTNGSFFANRLTVENNGSIIVQGTNTLTVTNEVKVLGNGVFIFENNSSLVQVSEAVNTGNITYRRNSTPIRRLDLTYWSSPVTRVPAFTLHDLSPNTLLDKYYRYDPNLAWVSILNGTEEMVKGNGYSIRAPQPYDPTSTQIYGGEFIGVPNNGTILGPTAVAGKSNLLGNPYPSAIYADRFIFDNQANYYGTLYFWTHNTLPTERVPGEGVYYYTNNDFAIYNLSGTTVIGSMTGNGATSPGNQNPPLGYIAAGQGFIAKSKTGQKAVFTNTMRVAGYNSQFFKSSIGELERHRVWLNMTNTQGAYKQILVGYIEGATNFWDDNYDGITLDANPLLDFYSINEDKKLIIQGRALPFVESDTIPLGYRSATAGDFTIAIDRSDGNLSNHAIYLQDKVTKTIHNLRTGAYTFTTQSGVFRERFVLRYTDNTLGTDSFASLDENVLVSVKDKKIKLESISESNNLKETSVYDIGGKLLYHKKDINNKEFLITNLQPAYQILLIKITLDNGYTITKKVAF